MCHPALVAALDAGIEGTTPFVVTPCQSGETLDVVMRRLPPLSLPEALAYLTPVAEAIDAAAAAGIDHGALHPRDIFIAGAGSEAPGSIHVTGFGIARALESVNVSAETIRRPYAAPERSTGTWDARADIYSLGVIAHELLTRCRPAGAGEQDGVFSASIAPQHRVRVRKALAGALAESSDRRYATAGEFVDALRAIGARDVVSNSARTVPTVAVVEAPQQASLYFSAEAPSGDVVSIDVPATEGSQTEAFPSDVPSRGIPSDVVIAEPPVPLILSVEADTPVAAPVQNIELTRSAHDVLASVPLRRVPAPTVGAVRGQARTTRRTPASPRLLVVAFAAAAVVVGALGAYFTGSSYRPAPGTTVSTQPAPRDENSDATVGAAAPGASSDVLPPDATTSADTDAQANAARRAQARDVRPVSAPAGRLVIRSEPSGALVTVDGRNWGATPTTVKDLSLGTHAVRVARPGHVPRLERVTLRSAAPMQTLTFALEPGLAAQTPVLGAIDIDSRPRAARVIVDGRFVGQAPLRIPQLRPGTYAVTLELDGYTSLTSRVTVEAGKSAALRPALRSTN